MEDFLEKLIEVIKSQIESVKIIKPLVKSKEQKDKLEAFEITLNHKLIKYSGIINDKNE